MIRHRSHVWADVKYNDNDGHNEVEDEVASAFCFFTYTISGGTLVITDIQGVGNFYTDPQIHTLDGHGFGAGNMGERGIQRYLLTHRHSLLCEQLGLASPDAALSDEQLAAKVQADEERIAAEAAEAATEADRAASDEDEDEDEDEDLKLALMLSRQAGI